MFARILSLDASTKTGWALFVDGNLTKSGALPQVKVQDFNVNKDPQLAASYPYNIVDGAGAVVLQIKELVKQEQPDMVVVENTNKGRNRHTQRLLEFIHLKLLMALRSDLLVPMIYMDTSRWRSLVQLWLSKDDRKNNRDVSAGKKRGRVNKKHLAVRMVNDLYGKKLKLKDNDEADAILMGRAFVSTHSQEQAA